ncbi:ATP-binding protein [Paenibacillus sp. J2TS4]|uniref:hybrid sensor histidine kinase/response regulator n=1 Tax=Paenibacillus sp. J2TS4 TaxID=2807194 RepID=UPI0020BE1D20|nr:ATP-binding protein [Paenibacillus sp. J2TS4]
MALLTGFRFLWLHFYTVPDHPHAFQGELDLRNWEPLADNSITLDGEWQFFPNTLLMQSTEDTHSTFSENGADVIQVPGNWNVSEQTDRSSTYGFGTYRLRILVDPDKGSHYGIRIPSIHSSSEVYINGNLLVQSGQPAENKQQYKPLDVPIMAYFTLEKTNVIELVIQVANYDNAHNGGIFRSLKFGLADTFSKDITFATGVVLIACVVYLIHALYGFILYLVGKRDRRLLYFSLMILCVILGTLMDGDRLLFAWVPFNFEWSIKVLYLVMISGGYFLLQCIKHKLPDYIRFKLFTPYVILCGVSIGMILLLPASANLMLETFYSIVMFIPCLLAPLAMYRATVRINRDNIFLLLAVIAAIGSLIWLFIIYALRIEMISYPFDLMIATICFSTYWFKQYFRVLDKSQQLTVKLQKADKHKDEFLAMVAHELRNPLHGIINISQSVSDREKGTLKERSAQDLELLSIVGRRMSLMLDDLLDLARLRESRLSLQPVRVSVHNVAEAVMDILRYMTEGKPIQLVNRIPSHFPLVIADENRLTQILFNLLHNAVKYSQAREVSVYASIEDNWARISVVDNGIGMDNELMSKIFEPYEQASTPSTGSGFGLGLSICKLLVELHGGTLEVSSKLNQGSIFTFTLEVSVSSSQPEVIPSPVAKLGDKQIAAAKAWDKLNEAVEQSSPSDPVRILAVDDDPMNLKVLESVFSIEPYEIVTATSGPEALSLLESGEWDLVIADVMMPNMSGYELTSRIRERFPISELPVLLLTSCSRNEDIEAGFRAGANDYVTKPMNAVELKSRVQSLTRLKRSISERLRMEAAWLQAQVRPHFIINTFTAIAALGKIDTNRMDALIEELSNYLRLSIDFQNSDRVASLEHELQLIRSYLFIQKERFGDRLRVVWEIDEPIQLDIPPLSIQPLVENAIIHGLLKRSKGGEIRIRITEREQWVEISVADNGVGMDSETLKQLLDRKPDKRSRIGLLNTDRRLKQFYGVGLKIESKLGEGTTVSFTVPKTGGSKAGTKY